MNYRELFVSKICGLSTSQYLSDADLNADLTRQIRKTLGEEAVRLRDRCLRPSHVDGRFRVALCNASLATFTGSELWTVETARHLKRTGHDPIIFSNRIGPVAELATAAGVEVTSDTARIAQFAPAIIHTNHFDATSDLIRRLAAHARIINMCHGFLPRQGLPGNDSVDRYCAVSVAAQVKISALTGVAPAAIPILTNFFDPERFAGASGHRRGRALLFSSRTNATHREHLRSALAIVGLTLDHLGTGGVRTQTPETLLPDYEVVFAVGRSAIEAMACGARVVLWDNGIVGEAVSPANFWTCLAANFALSANALPWSRIEDALDLAHQLDSINGDQAAEVTGLVREHLTISSATSRLLDVYASAEAARLAT